MKRVAIYIYKSQNRHFSHAYKVTFHASHQLKIQYMERSQDTLRDAENRMLKFVLDRFLGLVKNICH